METLIKIENLSVKHEERKAIEGINLTIYEGEKIGIIGPNGAGKSTLLLAIKGLIKFSGKISFSGIDKSAVGLVFQNPDIQLFMPTVFDDVAFGPINQNLTEMEVRERVKESLAKVGLSGFEKRTPHHLSEGEKKKVAIATVLSMEPTVYLFDEPTTGLDPLSKYEITKILCFIDRTMLIATHDLELISRITSRTVILNNGKLMADGETRDILSNKELLAKNKLYPLEQLLNCK